MIEAPVRLLALFVASGLFDSTGCTPPWSTPEPDPRVQGVVEYDEWTAAFEIGGRIRSLPIEEGGKVAPGDLLAALDDRLERVGRDARVLEAEAAKSQTTLLEAGTRREDLAAMSSRIHAAKASEELLANNLRRQEALLAQGATTRATVDDLRSQLERAVAERQSLEDTFKSMRKGARKEEISVSQSHAAAVAASVTQTEERIRLYELRAPRPGVVLDLHVDEGEVVAPAAPVATLADTTHPYADVFVAQDRMAGVALGSSATLEVDGDQHRYQGRVEWISNHTEFTPRYLFSERERATLVVRVRIRIDDPEARLHAGVPARVEIELAPTATP